MALEPNKPVLIGLAKRLVEEKRLTEQQALEAREHAKSSKIHFVSYLVQNRILDSRVIAESASAEFGFPIFDLATIDPEVIPHGQINDKLLQQHHALPLFKRGNRLFVAISDPTNLSGLDEIKFNTGLNTDAVLVEENKLKVLISGILEKKEAEAFDKWDDDLANIETVGGDELADEHAPTADDDDAPVVKFVNKMLIDAIKKGASDLHFEPYEKRYRVRFRIDGVLAEASSPPISLSGRIAARLKVMSKLDIAERRVPQDGRIKMRISANRVIDFRVSTCPMLFGEKVVLRILDPTSTQLGIESLGYEDEQRELYVQNLNKPQGMILVTGPTGSGKTVSLYTGLNLINKPGVNISTAEDPVEFNFEGINQVNVNPKAGLTFAGALRSFLRQDPDVIMVGEIRDLETAEIAIKAAQTGHMVLSTLHTNSAPATLNRLMNMGVPGYNIANAVNLIIAQRLARKLCDSCKKPVDIPKEALLEAGFKPKDLEKTFKVYEPVGCEKCSSGYKGRLGIYQVMPMTEGIATIIMQGGTALEIAKQAEIDGINDLRRSGLLKIAQGLTSLAEINRVTTE